MLIQTAGDVIDILYIRKVRIKIAPYSRTRAYYIAMQAAPAGTGTRRIYLHQFVRKGACTSYAAINDTILELAQHNARCNLLWTIGISIQILEVLFTRNKA